MKIIINRFLFIIFLISLIAPATALINVTADATGDTWITWSWDTGLNVTTIYVDGYQMCGYESTSSSFDVTGLTSCYLHNVTIFTDTDNGTNLSYTTCPVSISYQNSGTVRQEGFSGVMWLVFGLVGGIIGIVIISRR